MVNRGPTKIALMFVAAFVASAFGQRQPAAVGASYPRDPIRGDAPCSRVSPGAVATPDCDDGGNLPLTEQDKLRRFPAVPAAYSESEVPSSSGGVVSALQLQNPLSKQGKKLLESAKADLKAGKTAKAMAELQSAIEDPSAGGYAHAILGSYFVANGQPGPAVEELHEAAHLIPGDSAVRSNFAVALLAVHQYQDAEREARESLRLDWGSPQPHYILALALLGQNTRKQEAADHLQIAAESLPCARAALAQQIATK